MNLTIDVAGIAALIVAVVALWKALRQAPVEINQMEAGTIKIYEEAARLAAERTISMQKQIDSLLAAKDSLQAKLDQLQNVVNQLEAERKTLSAWVERLEHQVMAMGEVPATHKTKKAGAT